MAAKNNRTLPRILFSSDKNTFRVNYCIKNAWYPCEIFDINTQGAAMRINQSLLPGDTLKIEIQSTNGSYILDAVVKNVNGLRIGVAFLDIDSFQIEFLEDLMHLSHSNRQSIKYKNTALNR